MRHYLSHRPPPPPPPPPPPRVVFSLIACHTTTCLPPTPPFYYRSTSTIAVSCVGPTSRSGRFARETKAESDRERERHEVNEGETDVDATTYSDGVVCPTTSSTSLSVCGLLSAKEASGPSRPVAVMAE